MAVYTIELGRLIKTGYDIGLNDYPLPSYLSNDNERNQFRAALNQKIINHYTFDEICCTAPDRFKQLLNNTMREIMPVKNLLYDALAENWKFYAGSSLTEVVSDTRSDTHSNSQTGTDRTDRTGSDKATKTGTDTTAKTGNDKVARSGVDTVGNISNTTSSNNGYVLSVGSDTPAQMLSIESDIANNTYASSANKNKSTGSSTGNATSTDTTTYNSTNTTTYNNTDTTTYGSVNTTTTTGTDTTTHEAMATGNDTSKYERSRTVTGLSGKSYAELLKEYQEAIRNVDMEIIEALSSCFMSIY